MSGLPHARALSDPGWVHATTNPTGTAWAGLSTRPGTGGKGAHVMAHDNLPEIDGDEILPIEEDTIEEQVDGEHPDGDYPQSIYDDDPDEPIEGEAAICEGEVTA